MESLICDRQAPESTSFSPTAPIWQDVLAQAVTGELVAAMNYSALSKICDDPREVAEALEHAQIERGHAAAFAAEGRKLGVVVSDNVDGKHWKRIREAFMRCIAERATVACLIIQELMLSHSPSQLFPRCQGRAWKSRQNFWRHRRGGGRARRSRHGDSQSRAALDTQRLDDKMHRLHMDVMTTLARMLARDARTDIATWPKLLCEAFLVRNQPERSRASRSLAPTVPEDAGRVGTPRRGHTSMGGAAASLDFALIGHLESWKAAADVLSALRGPERTRLPDDEIRDILPWIPPRAVCRVEVGAIAGVKARGLYIDSFISPDRLCVAYVLENLTRVRAAAACAIAAGARIVSLGGFSSILIEGNFDQLPDRHNTVFTTGNTLTVAFIVQGIEKMCALRNRDLRRSTLMVFGATGDVGSGCVRSLAGRVKRVVLCARNVDRLRRLARELEADGVEVEIVTELERLSSEPDIVICAASLPSPSLLLSRVAPDAIVCDAGYPKNLSPGAEMPGVTVFFGGLGQISSGLRFAPDLHGILNHHPFPNVAHGCLLEGIALTLEGRFEPFSRGRGSVTRARVEEMEMIAERHGIHLAPLYNADGPLI